MAAPELAGVPVLILREGASRSRGREAQCANIMAAKIVAESVRARREYKPCCEIKYNPKLNSQII